MIEIGEVALVAMVDQDSIHQVGEVVADRAIHRPVVGQVFAGLKDFLDQHVQRGMLVHPVVLRRRPCMNFLLDAVRGERRFGIGAHALAGGIQHLQADEVLQRIQQAVGMIDAYARRSGPRPAACG